MISDLKGYINDTSDACLHWTMVLTTPILIFRSESDREHYAQIATVTDENNYTDETTVDNFIYFYKVQTQGEGGYSNEVFILYEEDFS